MNIERIETITNDDGSTVVRFYDYYGNRYDLTSETGKAYDLAEAIMMCYGIAKIHSRVEDLPLEFHQPPKGLLEKQLSELYLKSSNSEGETK